MIATIAGAACPLIYLIAIAVLLIRLARSRRRQP